MTNCYHCHRPVVFDEEHIGKNGRKIPLDPATHQPHDCPMREKQFNPQVDTGSGDKDDHGNEEYGPPPPRLLEESPRFVDHTAKPTLKIKTITDPNPEGFDLKYNAFAKEHKIQFSQYQLAPSLYTMVVWYSEAVE